MRAILLAAGFGTRLKPITLDVPKCLVTVGNKALLEIWLDKLFASGVERVLINTHYLSNLVEAFVESSKYRKYIDLFHEPSILGTAGTLFACLDFIGQEPILVAHADNLSKFNFSDFVAAHNKRPKYCNMTMMLFKSDDPKSCGIVELDKSGVVINFYEKVLSPPSNLANAATYIIEPELIRKYQSHAPKISDISTEIIPKNLGNIYTYLNTEYHRDIGTLESLKQANIDCEDFNDYC